MARLGRRQCFPPIIKRALPTVGGGGTPGTDGPNPPSAAVGDGSGAILWTDLPNAFALDGSYAIASGGSFDRVSTIQLLLGGSTTGSAKGPEVVTGSDADYTFGGAADVWGATLDDTDVNSSGFGVRLDPGTANAEAADFTTFGFAVPSGATIDGVECLVRGHATGGKTGAFRLDHITLKIYYTDPGGGGGDTSRQYQCSVGLVLMQP